MIWRAFHGSLYQTNRLSCLGCATFQRWKVAKDLRGKPRTPFFNESLFSISRCGQGVRYALLAPLPLAFCRAKIFTLNIQAPGRFWTLRVRAAVVAILEKRFRQRACRVTFAGWAVGAAVGNELLRPNRRATIFSLVGCRKTHCRKPYFPGARGGQHGRQGGFAAAVRLCPPSVILWFLFNHLERNPPRRTESFQ